MSDPANTSAVATTKAHNDDSVRQAIAQAARSRGMDFGFLLAQAKVESGLDPDAKAKTSTATGLFQFIESTWLRMAERHGSAMGLGSQLDLSDAATRRDVLALRSNPHFASRMAAALAQENSAALTPILGREPDASELYLAHFLGSGEAIRFLKKLDRDPNAAAAPLFTAQAGANRTIFYNNSGVPRTFGEVMGLLHDRIEAAMPSRTPVSARPSSSIPMRSAPAQHLEQQSPPPLSRILASQFALSDDPEFQSQSGDHARRAYDRLRAFGL